MMQSKSRLLWACRRGMLELDVLLQPFVQEHYEQLSETDQSLFQRLLECDDPDLFNWFMGHRQCPDPQLDRMVHVILSHNQPAA
ncbi:succinate dehydrogenase assembly factor 2 [Celerinatantimonas sp. YJH-8]|uniref:FAD assembly factor SdhE n=1 Tax=Celerinatantimonas sp. YJH-8 TaxID=3228714 RepID=UPI0038BF5BAD